MLSIMFIQACNDNDSYSETPTVQEAPTPVATTIIDAAKVMAASLR